MKISKMREEATGIVHGAHHPGQTSGYAAVSAEDEDDNVDELGGQQIDLVSNASFSSNTESAIGESDSKRASARNATLDTETESGQQSSSANARVG